MGLKDLRSNLKTLKFGQDTPGGGSSGLPYIQPGLPENSPAGEYLAGIARTSSDWPLRGGAYSTVAATEDSVRISRFLTDFPKGAIFTAKQVGLQKSNPRIETGGFTSRLNTQTYNLNANLLAQVFEQGTGVHIPRAGANTNELGPDGQQSKYEYIVSHKDTNENRLVTLFDTKILNNIGSNLDKLGISTDSNLLFDYPGGPGSVYGDDNTLIARTVNTDPTLVTTTFQGIPFRSSLNYQELMASKAQSTADLAPLVVDFRYENYLNNEMASRDYTNPLVNIATRVGIGNPGSRISSQRKYINQVNKGGQDKVNMMPLYSEDDATDPFIDKLEARDLIKFAFEVIDNDNPGTTTRAHFRAYITSFTDNHTADWSGQRYMGRGEKFYNYQGFERQLSFQFKVVAQSKQEMLPLYQKLNYIVSSLYPDYSTGGFMRGNLSKLTIGEYLCRTPGIITSMNISVDDNYPWEIKMTEPETQGSFTNNAFPVNNFDGTTAFQNSNSDADQMELPKILNVSVTFIPILSELPSLSKFTNSTQGGKHILISDRGIQENFINRIGLKRTNNSSVDLNNPNAPYISTPNT